MTRRINKRKKDKFMIKRTFNEPVIDNDMAKIADHFGVDISKLRKYIAPETYIIDLNGDLAAQAIYKELVPFGNTGRPGNYDFSKEILVRWNGTKVTAV